jgi:hypothetical protein
MLRSFRERTVHVVARTGAAFLHTLVETCSDDLSRRVVALDRRLNFRGGEL